jgi:hypothetical protein
MKTTLQGWKKICINTITNTHIHQQQMEGQQHAQNMSHSDTAANQRY